MCTSEQKEQCESPGEQENKYSVSRNQEVVHLALAACGEEVDRFEEATTLLKSAVLFTTYPIHFHIFADDYLKPKFEEEISGWPDSVKSKLTYSVKLVQFPQDKKETWKKLFKLCASQRVFLPDLLTDVDKLLYVDTDILFLRPVEDIWAYFHQFNSTQLAGLAWEHLQQSISWYARFAKHPYYGPYGINSGVMLMDLAAMRKEDWSEKLGQYHKEYKLIPWGDQDLINIYFSFYPEKLYTYDCDWNYRPDFCMYMSHCQPAEENGISIVHGNRRVYHNEKQPAFKAVYQAIRDYRFEDDIASLLTMMEQNLEKAKVESAAGQRMNCGRVTQIFTKQLAKEIDKVKLKQL